MHPNLQTLASDIRIWRGITVNGNAGAKVVLQTGILALGGTIPTAPRLEVEIFADAAILRVYRDGLTAANGGDYVTIPANGSKVIPLVSGLDRLSVLADGAGATVCHVMASFGD